MTALIEFEAKVLEIDPDDAVRKIATAGTSDQRTRYRLPDDRTLYAKTIRPVRLPATCASCRFNNRHDCLEGYYGVRLYRAEGGPFMVGVCIQRMDLCVDLGTFVMSQLCREVRELRADEQTRLASWTAGQLLTAV